MNMAIVMQRMGDAFGPIAQVFLIMGATFLFYLMFIDPLTAPISIEIFEKRKNGYKRKTSVGKIVKKNGVSRLKIYNMAGPINMFFRKATYIYPVDGRFLISIGNKKDKLILVKDGDIFRPVEPAFDRSRFDGYSDTDIEFWAQQERKNTMINYATPLKGFEKISGIISLLLVIGIVLTFFVIGLREMNKAIDSASSANAKAAEISKEVLDSSRQVMDEAKQVLVEIKQMNGGK